MRLLGRGRQESLIGAYEKPPAMPEDTYFLRHILLRPGYERASIIKQQHR